jgi:hypothetical protein
MWLTLKANERFPENVAPDGVERTVGDTGTFVTGFVFQPPILFDSKSQLGQRVHEKAEPCAHWHEPDEHTSFASHAAVEQFPQC